MRTRWRGALGAALIASCVPGSAVAGMQMANAAAASAPLALAYVSNGQVTVFEAGTLTTTGPGQDPVWSPNGANLLYMRPDFIANLADLFVADKHGANAQRLFGGVYPYIPPTWSPDSKYILYTAAAKGSATTGQTVNLEVRAFNLATRQVRVLGAFTLSGGCSPNGTALQVAMTTAQGSHQGTPSTLIWAQPNLVVVQESCTGNGLLMFKTGGKPVTLSGWSAAALSPDGKSIAASVIPRGGKAVSAQVGVITVATGKTQILKAKVTANAVTWTHDGKYIVTVANPANPAIGSVQIAKLTPNGKTVTRLGAFPAAGAYHPSLDRNDRSLALAVVGSVKTVGVPPPTFVELAPTQKAGPATPFFPGSQPAWRP
jgi:Tol biopolymer transport system component